MERFLRDFRYGFRSLVKSKALALVAIVALTLGIGLTTTMFSITYGALMKGLPFAEGNRIVELRRDQLTRTVAGLQRIVVVASLVIWFRWY